MNRLSAIVDALTRPKQVAQQDPFLLNQGLEQAAAPNNTPMTPLVQALANKLGLLAMMRNRSNSELVDPSIEGPLQ